MDQKFASYSSLSIKFTSQYKYLTPTTCAVFSGICASCKTLYMLHSNLINSCSWDNHYSPLLEDVKYLSLFTKHAYGMLLYVHMKLYNSKSFSSIFCSCTQPHTLYLLSSMPQIILWISTVFLVFKREYWTRLSALTWNKRPLTNFKWIHIL